MSVSTPTSQVDQHRFLPVHLKVLSDRGIDPQLAWDAGLRSLDFRRSELERKLWSERNPGQPTYPSTALMMPSWSTDADGCRREHTRLRWDDDCYWTGTPGTPEVPVSIPRYTCAKGDNPPPFIVPWLDKLIGDTTRPIFVVEAALKALALQTIGLDAIGLAGVEVGAKDPELWARTRQLAIHPELKPYAQDRDAYVSFDAGAAFNSMVALAQARACYVLDKEGANVRIVRLPKRDRDSDLDTLMRSESDDQGPDDFIVAHGADAYRELVAQSVPGNPLAWVQSVIAAHKGERKDQIGQRLADLLRDIPFLSLLDVFPAATLDQVALEYKRYAAIGKKALTGAIAELRASRAERARDEHSEGPHFKLGDHAEIAAHLFAKYTVGPVAPIYDEGALHAYDPERGVWTAISDDKLSQDIQTLSGAAVGEKRQLLITNALIHGTVQCLIAKVRSPGFFAAAPRDGVAMRNGYARVTASGVDSEAHSPDHRQRHHYAFDYKLGQRPRRFIECLEYAFRGDDDAQQKIDLLQEFAGICRVGQATRYEQAIFMHGPRADDGKSTVLAILAGTFDAASVASLSPWEIGDRFRLQELVGRTINITDDDRSDRIKYAGLFKSLVTAKDGMLQPFERKGKDIEKFRPFAGHISACNTLPTADDSTNGWFRRQLVIQFNNQVETARKVRSYETSILAEEQQAIVCWTLDGAARCIQQNGYTVPASSVEAVNEWRKHACSAYLFADEGCTIPDDAARCSGAAPVGASLKELYAAYLAFCEDRGIEHRYKQSTLGSKLEQHRHKTATGNHYHLQVVDTAAREREVFERDQTAAEREAQAVADHVERGLAQHLAEQETDPLQEWSNSLVLTMVQLPTGKWHPLCRCVGYDDDLASMPRILRAWRTPPSGIDSEHFDSYLTADSGAIGPGCWDDPGHYAGCSVTVSQNANGTYQIERIITCPDEDAPTGHVLYQQPEISAEAWKAAFEAEMARPVH
jgi:phage/plasmid-associated DNA primase